MYWKGHVGAGLLAYSPFGMVLVRADFVVVALLGTAVVVLLASLPDLDHRLPLVTHRGFTHTVGFAMIVGGVVGAAGYYLATVLGPVVGSPRGLARFGFAVGTLTILVHVVVDALTPHGVRPLWPLIERRVALGVVKSKNPFVNYVLLLAGVVASGAGLFVGMTG